MGNALSNFDIKDQPSTGGPGRLYKTQRATKKTGQPCTIFLFDKSQISRVNPLGKSSAQKDYEYISKQLIREVQQMTRLRHPSILHILDPLNETPQNIGFVAEPLVCTLADFTSKSSLVTILQFQDAELDELGIQLGMMQILKGLEFLHKNLIVHLCLCPESVFVDPQGTWKIGGFVFASQLTDSEQGNASIDVLPPFCQPRLGFFAPEVVLDRRCYRSSDIWSLGSLIYSIYNSGTPFNTAMHPAQYRDGYQQLSNLPTGLEPIMRQMTATDYRSRPGARQILDWPYFKEGLVTIFQALETLVERTPIEKAKMLPNLVPVLNQFSIKTVKNKILPILLQELRDASIVPFVLPSLFWIIDKLEPKEFQKLVWDNLKPYCFKVMEPPQATLMILKKLDLLMDKLENQHFKQGSTNVQIQTSAVGHIKTMSPKLEFLVLKNELLPVLEKAVTTTASVQLKTSGFQSLANILHLLDRPTITEKVLPIVEKDDTQVAQVTMSKMELYKAIAEKMDYITTCTSIIPQLWRMSMDGSLSVDQFQQMMSCIDGLGFLCREQHLKKLRETPASVETSLGSTSSEKLVGRSQTTNVFPSLFSSSKSQADAKPMQEKRSSLHQPALNPPPSASLNPQLQTFTPFPSHNKPLMGQPLVGTFNQPFQLVTVVGKKETALPQHLAEFDTI
ncbi:kinase-like domain-containing protein [Gorgonomyces haynaldii]|nr:kinase-like domain-containing protein [Gorgonomyces haynaldii]